MRYKEVEFKYDASSISLESFNTFCLSRKPTKIKSTSGYDYFYSNDKEDMSFGRYRTGPDIHQVTFKKKTAEEDNFIRTEINVDLAPSANELVVNAMFDLLGYKFDFTLFKQCMIYEYEWYTLVYYICYGENMTEMSRFIEIEMKEDFEWKSEKQEWNELLLIEKTSRDLGIDSKNRLKKSLFELYRRKQ